MTTAGSSRGTIHVWPSPSRLIDGQHEAGFVLELPDSTRVPIVYRIPERLSSPPSERADAYALACVFVAMQRHTDLHLHGEASPSLLRSLDEFQRAWQAWVPRYVPAEVRADVEREAIRPDRRGAVTGFSCGVDSCFTLLRHTGTLQGRWRRHVDLAVTVHGFGIKLDDGATFARLASRAERLMTERAPHVTWIPLVTNVRQETEALGASWPHSCGAVLASVLHLFAESHDTGLVAGEATYQFLVLPDGSNPVTDHLLGSLALPIVTDGSSFERPDKLAALAAWPAALASLQVCWEGGQRDRNCGKCEKCIRTILAARVAGLPLPACFDEDPSTEDVRRVLVQWSKSHPVNLMDMQRIFRLAKARGITQEWVHLFDAMKRPPGTA